MSSFPRSRPRPGAILILTLSVGSLGACDRDDESVTSKVDDYIDALSEQAEILCDCWETLDDGTGKAYASRSSCLKANGQVLPSTRQCYQDAFARSQKGSTTFLDCYLPLERDLTLCLDDRFTCKDFSEATPCFEDYDIGAKKCVDLPNTVERGIEDCSN